MSRQTAAARHPSRHRPGRPVPRRRRRSAGASSSMVSCCSGSLPMAGWSWRARVMLEYEARRQPTSSVRSKTAASSRGGVAAFVLPAAAGRLADPLDRDHGPERGQGRFDRGVGARLARRTGRRHPGRHGRRAAGPAASAGCPWRRPTTGRPGGAPGSGRRRASGGPRPRPSSSSIFWCTAKLVALVPDVDGAPVGRCRGRGTSARRCLWGRPSHM